MRGWFLEGHKHNIKNQRTNVVKNLNPCSESDDRHSEVHTATMSTSQEGK